jgi:hypothetical protein
MDSQQIERILYSNSLTKQLFRGCTPSDGLPNSIQYPSAFIVNLDPHQFDGSHWIAIYVKRQEVCYFDSLALPINEIINDTFLQKFPRIRRNVKAYQSLLNNTCAHHCISFIYFISKGFDFEQYLNLLDTKCNPDLFVRTIVKKLINVI